MALNPLAVSNNQHAEHFHVATQAGSHDAERAQTFVHFIFSQTHERAIVCHANLV
jgi:hypothetical protein